MIALTRSEVDLRAVRLALLIDLDRAVQSATPKTTWAWQLTLVDEIRRTEKFKRAHRTRAEANHLHLLRVLGDTLVWHLLDPLTIRVLARDRAPHAPNITGQASSFEHVLRSGEALVSRGKHVILADVTHSIQTGDLLSISDRTLWLHECKDRQSALGEVLGGRVGRQITRMVEALNYLNGAIHLGPKNTDGTPWIALPVSTERTFGWSEVEVIVSHTLESGTASAILEPSNVIVAADQDHADPQNFSLGFRGIVPPVMVAGHSHLLGDANDQPPPTAWPLPFATRAALFEGDVLLTHIVGMGEFAREIRSDLAMTGVDNDAIRVRTGSMQFDFGARYLRDVLLGYELLASAVPNAMAILTEITDTGIVDFGERVQAFAGIIYRDGLVPIFPHDLQIG